MGRLNYGKLASARGTRPLAFLLAALSCGLLGCEEKPPPPPGADSAGNTIITMPKGASEYRVTAQGDADAASGRYIYVDSVPRGAIVTYRGSEKRRSKAVLGKTPLKVDASICPDRVLEIMMPMEHYFGAVAKIPEMTDWVNKFKADRPKIPEGQPQTLFSLDSSAERYERATDGTLTGVGPIYKLDDEHDRVCAVFIPREVPREAFFPLMPAQNTFPSLPRRVHAMLQTEFHLSPSQMESARDSLNRCGKYVVTVPRPGNKAQGVQIALTWQENRQEVRTQRAFLDHIGDDNRNP